MKTGIMPKWLRRADLQERLEMKAGEPTDALPYRPDLVVELRAEHNRILQLFNMFSIAHRNGHVDAAVDALFRFSRALRGHLLKENLYLYVYLAQVLQNDRESAEIMRGMRREMQSIGRTLNAFTARYTASPWDSATRDRLSGELDEITRALLHRIESEETVLYPLYLPRASYAG